MLHKRCLPKKEFDDLKLVFDFKIALIDWLLRTPAAKLNDKTDLIAQFGQRKANWIWLRMRSPSKRTGFGKAMDALLLRASTNQNQAIAVADAIAADGKFDVNWAQAGFELQFPRLHKDWLTSVAKVAAPFYDWFSAKGFDAQTFGLHDGMMTRVRLMESYRKQACGVCGYCDGVAGEKGTKKDANDCDHFFPRSHWPHLSIHPRNLYAACKGCNQTWKVNKKPMGSGDVAGLSGTYHPMLRPGVGAIEVTASQSVASPRKVSIHLVDTSFPLRAQTLTNSLDLEARWANWANEKLDRKISALVAKSVQHRISGQPMTEAELASAIQTDIKWYEKNLGTEPNGLRLKAVLEYQQQAQLPKILSEL